VSHNPNDVRAAHELEAQLADAERAVVELG
jgi:hypothetical protein